MDFLQKLLGDKAPELVSSLIENTGFSADQARAFVPEATGAVVDAVRSAGNIDFSNIEAASRAVMRRIDVSSLADKVGIGTEQAQSGLNAIVRSLLQLFQQKAGGTSDIMSMLSGLKQGGMLGGLDRFFGKH